MKEEIEEKDLVKHLSGSRSVSGFAYDWSLKVFSTADGKYYGHAVLAGKHMTTGTCEKAQEAQDWGCNMLAHQFALIEEKAGGGVCLEG